VIVKIRALDQAGTLLDQVVQAGATSVNGSSFSVENPDALLAQAREQAVQDARVHADVLAKAGGAAVGDILVISENIGAPPPVPLMLEARAAADSKAVPVQPGEQSFSVEVQVTYQLQ
jgi:uncharacterized protein YggE